MAPLELGRVPTEEEPDTVLIGRGGIFFGRVVGTPNQPAAEMASLLARSLQIIELAAAHLGLDPAVLAERLAALPGGGIGELVDEAKHHMMSDGDPFDEPRHELESALKPFEKE